MVPGTPKRGTVALALSQEKYHRLSELALLGAQKFSVLG